MDISETYIKMCDCEEIQGNRTLLIGDWYQPRHYSPWTPSWVVVGSASDAEVAKKVFYGMFIWLPRQDQLQEMVESIHPFDLLNKLQDFVRVMPIWCESMEQLWLAFAQKELHNKFWNGEKWIKGGKE